jgi:hypothetical protein
MMLARIAAVALLLALAGHAAAGCGDETVVLATIPDVDAYVAAPSRCVQTSDCPGGSFCDLGACDQPAGTCEPFPVQCDDDARPVCGCDGITYFNDCLRRAAGVPGSRGGECGPFGLHCGGAAPPCPSGAACARLLGFPLPQGCPADPVGTCWVVPAACSDAGASNRWDDCTGGARCVSTCDAIRSGGSYVRSRQCF